jgi:hypothetical protein
MKSPPLLSIREATISFAKKILFENLHLHLFPRDRNWIVIGMAQTLVLGLLPLLLHLAFQSPSLSKSPLQFVVVHTLDVALAIWSFLFLFFIFKTIVSGQGLNLEATLCTSPSGLPLTETNSKEIPNADVQLEKN